MKFRLYDKVKNVIFFPLAGLLSIFFLLIFILSIFYVQNKRNSSGYKSVKGHLYQYSSKVSSVNESFFGIASIPEKIEIGEYYTSSRYNGRNAFVVSNFGEEEYECFGSCYCDAGSRRRNVAVLERGMTFLLVSISLAISYEIAKEHFEKECAEKFPVDDDCDSVTVSIEKCNAVISEKKEKYPIDEKDEERTFYCYGNCVKNRAIKSSEETFQVDEFGCEKLKREGEVVVRRSEVRKESIYKFAARAKFSKYYLNDFCRQISSIDNASTKELKKKFLTVHACVGNGVKAAFRNVHCRQVLPKSKSPNAGLKEKQWKAEKEIWDDIW